METAKVDVRKLQLLNDRINQVMEVLTQVRLSVHGIQHTAQTGSPQPYAAAYGMPLGSVSAQPWQPIAQPFVSPYASPFASSYSQSFASPYGQSVVPQVAPHMVPQVAQQLAQQVVPQIAQQIAGQIAQQIGQQITQQIAGQAVSQNAISPGFSVPGSTMGTYPSAHAQPFAGQASPSFGPMMSMGVPPTWPMSQGTITEPAFPFLHAQQTPMSNGSWSSSTLNSAH